MHFLHLFFDKEPCFVAASSFFVVVFFEGDFVVVGVYESYESFVFEGLEWFLFYLHSVGVKHCKSDYGGDEYFEHNIFSLFLIIQIRFTLFFFDEKSKNFNIFI